MRDYMRPEDCEAILKILDEEVAKYIKAMPRYIKENLNKIVLAYIGVDSRFGDRYHLTGNGSCDPLIAKMIGELISECFQVKARPKLEEAIQKIMENDRLINSYIVDASETYKREFNERLQKHASNCAQNDADIIIRMFARESEQTGEPDINDPDAFKGKMGDIMLKYRAKKLAAAFKEAVQEVQ